MKLLIKFPIGFGTYWLLLAPIALLAWFKMLLGLGRWGGEVGEDIMDHGPCPMLHAPCSIVHGPWSIFGPLKHDIFDLIFGRNFIYTLNIDLFLIFI